MSRTKSLYLRIPEPCQENWELMDEHEKGRHCASCEKTVIDFTGMTDEDMMYTFQTRKNVCGRFLNGQLNRDLPALNRYQLWTRWIGKAGIAGIILSQLGQQKLSAQTVPENTPGDSIKHGDSVVLAQPVVLPVFTFGNNYGVKGEVFQPDSMSLRAISLDFKFDTFAIHCPLDSSNSFNFQLPTNVSTDTFSLTINGTQTSHTFHLGFYQFVTYWGVSLKDNRIQIGYSNGNWEVNNVQTPYFMPDITMGIVPIEWEQPWRPNIDFTGVFTLVTTDTTVADTLGQEEIKDSIPTINPAPITYDKPEEAPRSGPNWWYSLLLLIPLAWVMAVFFGKKNKPVEKQEDNENDQAGS